MSDSGVGAGSPPVPQRKRGLPPRTQANFVAGFTATYAIVYGALAYELDRPSCPPWYYWVVFVVVYFVFFATFYIRPLDALFSWVARGLDSLSVILNENASPGDSPTMEDAAPPSPGGFPLEDAFRVQALSASVIALTGWFTVYSGGPFESPYGQVLLALPLMSSLIAYDPRSVLTVYGVTFFVSVICHLNRIDYKPSENWSAGTTLSVLAVSFFLVWLAMQRRDARWALKG